MIRDTGGCGGPEEAPHLGRPSGRGWAWRPERSLEDGGGEISRSGHLGREKPAPRGRYGDRPLKGTQAVSWRVSTDKAGEASGDLVATGLDGRPRHWGFLPECGPGGGGIVSMRWHRWLCFRTSSLSRLESGCQRVTRGSQPPRPGPAGPRWGGGGGEQRTGSQETRGQGHLPPEGRQGHGEPSVGEDATASDGLVYRDDGMVTREKLGELARGS